VATAAPRPDTRSHILETAWALVLDRGTAVTVADAARAAGVSRQLLYFHFESRAGLLLAMARHHDVRSGFAGRVAEALAHPPVEALERLLRAWTAYVPEILPVAGALEAAVITGEEGAAAWRDRMGGLHDVLGDAVARVAAEGRLAAGWTVAAATDWAWARCQPSGWQHLVGERGWSPAEYAERSVRSILAELVTPEADEGRVTPDSITPTE
jgi:AcrR family transcriptional regulator